MLLQEVAASTGELADTLSQAQQRVTELHEAQQEQEQSLAALEDKAVSPEALQQLASTVSSVASDVEAARAEASQRESRLSLPGLRLIAQVQHCHPRVFSTTFRHRMMH